MNAQMTVAVAENWSSSSKAAVSATAMEHRFHCRGPTPCQLPSPRPTTHYSSNFYSSRSKNHRETGGFFVTSRAQRGAQGGAKLTEKAHAAYMYWKSPNLVSWESESHQAGHTYIVGDVSLWGPPRCHLQQWHGLIKFHCTSNHK